MALASTEADRTNSDLATNQHVTSQTLTLGRDSDYYFSVPDDHAVGAQHHHHDDVPPEEGGVGGEMINRPSHPWWQRLTNPFQSTTGPTAANPSSSESPTPSDSYRSLNEGHDENQVMPYDRKSENKSSASTGSSSTPERRRYHRTSVMFQQKEGAITQPILRNDTTSRPKILGGGGPSALSPSPEEELTRGSFFFREPVHDQGSSKSDALFPSSSTSSSQLVGSTPFRSSFQTLIRDSTHQEFAYRDAAAMHVALAPPVLSAYRTKYELLNRTLERPVPYGYYVDDYDDDLSEEGFQGHNNHNVAPHYDLELTTSDETDGNAPSTARRKDSLSKVTRTDSAALSSLLYRNNRGRVMLKLPSDQVRLVMDPDLHPGILSVEQWRRNEQQEYTTETARPDLHYVLTVPDDLYRRIVSELSDSVTSPYCGMSKCCSEKEFVDIRVAVSIVGATLAILLLLTCVWPVT